MTKMQIIAKTVLTVLGIHIVIALCSSCVTRYVGPAENLARLLVQTTFCAGFAALVAFVAYFMLFQNNDLSRKLAGPGQEIDRQTQIECLMKSLRAGLVFVGLMLIPGLLPRRLSPGEPLINTVYFFARAVLAVYLVCGAPHFVRWQTKRSLRQIANTEQVETPDSATAGPERTSNG